jgi:YD repeat-containing protein
MTARPGYRYEWDALGRLTKVKPPTGGSTIATYSYDPLDRLLLADYGGNDRLRFRYVGLTTSVAQVVNDQNGSVIRSIGVDWTGEHLLDWTGSDSNQRFHGTNGHHAVTWTADSTGAVSSTLRYDPWGTLTQATLLRERRVASIRHVLGRPCGARWGCGLLHRATGARHAACPTRALRG